MVSKAADCPTALYATHRAYDSKHQRFMAVVVFNGSKQPAAMFGYDPKQDAWHAIKPKNPIPPYKSWFGWMKLCYDADRDCLIGMVGAKFYAFRYVPAEWQPRGERGTALSAFPPSCGALSWGRVAFPRFSLIAGRGWGDRDGITRVHSR